MPSAGRSAGSGARACSARARKVRGRPSTGPVDAPEAFPVSSRWARIPQAYTSARSSVARPSHCSGATYGGDPATIPTAPATWASPRSRILMAPSAVMKTLAGFRSRWIDARRVHLGESRRDRAEHVSRLRAGERSALQASLQASRPRGARRRGRCRLPTGRRRAASPRWGGGPGRPPRPRAGSTRGSSGSAPLRTKDLDRDAAPEVGVLRLEDQPEAARARSPGRGGTSRCDPRRPRESPGSPRGPT